MVLVRDKVFCDVKSAEQPEPGSRPVSASKKRPMRWSDE